jgi:TolA-binding protein
MARLRCTARKSVIPFLPSRLVEHPLHRTVPGQSSQLERLHRRLHEEQERRRQEQEQEQQDSSPLPQQEVESGRPFSPAPQSEMPPAPPQGIPAAGGDPDGDGDDDDAGGSLSHGTELSEEPELEGWIARPITRDAALGCHFHNALDTLLRRAFDRHTWSIEYHCVVY